MFHRSRPQASPIGSRRISGTPPRIVTALNRAFVGAAKDPAVSRALKELGVEILPLRPEQAANLLRDETEVNRRVIALAGKIVAAPPAEFARRLSHQARTLNAAVREAGIRPERS